MKKLFYFLCFSIVVLLSSCEDLLNSGSELTQNIKQEVQYTSAPKVSVVFTVDNLNSGKYVSSPKEIKLGFENEISFEVNADYGVFDRWVAYAGYKGDGSDIPLSENDKTVVFGNIKNSVTSITVNKVVTGLRIVPLCKPYPTLLRSVPFLGMSQNRSTPVILQFSNTIDIETLKKNAGNNSVSNIHVKDLVSGDEFDTSLIQIRGVKSGMTQSEDYCKYFECVEINGNTLKFIPLVNEIPMNSQVSIEISNDVYSVDGSGDKIPLGNNLSFTWYVQTMSDVTAPVLNSDVYVYGSYYFSNWWDYVNEASSYHGTYTTGGFNHSSSPENDPILCSLTNLSNIKNDKDQDVSDYYYYVNAYYGNLLLSQSLILGLNIKQKAFVFNESELTSLSVIGQKGYDNGFDCKIVLNGYDEVGGSGLKQFDIYCLLEAIDAHEAQYVRSENPKERPENEDSLPFIWWGEICCIPKDDVCYSSLLKMKESLQNQLNMAWTGSGKLVLGSFGKEKLFEKYCIDHVVISSDELGTNENTYYYSFPDVFAREDVKAKNLGSVLLWFVIACSDNSGNTSYSDYWYLYQKNNEKIHYESFIDDGYLGK